VSRFLDRKSRRPGDPRRGRIKFFAIVAAAILLELAVLNVSVSTIVRLVLTGGLLFATWVGHGWARLTLVVGYCFGIVAVLFLGVSGLDSTTGLLNLLVLGVVLVLFAVSGWMLQFSTDLRSYLEVEKSPQPSDSRESERDG
jgi:hypothetical protein